MTVCVAVICDGSTVVGVSDRMLTSGDVQFAPRQSKIHWITSSIIAMISGDVALATELLGIVGEIVAERVRREPQNWWTVRDVADLWRAAHIARSQRNSETLLLAPLGLTTATFVSQQQQLSPVLVEKLTKELINFELPGVDVIFGGIDPSGAHLFVAHGSAISCMDAIGFVAVGSGGYHARSQLMFSGHTAASPLNKAVYYAYAAKKRAEVAPGVGSETDTVVVWQLEAQLASATTS